MIEYPDDNAVRAAGRETGIPGLVIVRDLVRVVEVLNLKRHGFFGPRSVLSGSMALRCFGSPRFTVYDADFSTRREDGERDQAQRLRRLFAYQDDDLTITPESVTSTDAGETLYRAQPVRFDAAFSSIVDADSDDSTFKADISFRRLELDGVQTPLAVPYLPGIWDAPPEVWVMNPNETVAEKILGWAAHGLLKHYADVGFAARKMTGKDVPVPIVWATVFEVLAAKRDAMAKLQPTVYADLPTVDRVINVLGQPPNFAAGQWNALQYVKPAQAAITRDWLVAGVQGAVSEMRRTRPR